MDDYPEQNILLTELLKERSRMLREYSVRRAVRVLDTKRQRIREELAQLIRHIALLIPLTEISSTSTEPYSDLLQDAIKQLGDDAFSELLLQVLQEVQ